MAERVGCRGRRSRSRSRRAPTSLSLLGFHVHGAAHLGWPTRRVPDRDGNWCGWIRLPKLIVTVTQTHMAVAVYLRSDDFATSIEHKVCSSHPCARPTIVMFFFLHRTTCKSDSEIVVRLHGQWAAGIRRVAFPPSRRAKACDAGTHRTTFGRARCVQLCMHGASMEHGAARPGSLCIPACSCVRSRGDAGDMGDGEGGRGGSRAIDRADGTHADIVRRS